MKNSNKVGYLFAVLGVLAIIFSLIAILVFTQSVGATKSEIERVPVASFSKGRQTYLVLGQDRASGLTDVMMLVSVDTKEKTAAVLQIPRDTYARYTEKGYRKFNGALSALGIDGLCGFVEDNMGVSIDGYFILDLDAFVKIVDALGGVEIDIPEGMYYRDDAQGLDIAFESGRQTLDGKAAEKFVRYRSGYLRGDLGRMDAQKIFLSAFINKVKSTMTPAKALRLASSVMGDIRTNVKLSDHATLAVAVFDIDEEDIMLVTLAGEDIRSKVSGAWYYVVSKSSAEDILREVLGAEKEFDCDGVFRNPDNESFEKIYFSSVRYESKTSKDISQNGIEIEKR